ncbi:CCR4-NOT transcriptional complex subunit CAF120 [Cryptococcus neoformans A2-102-5]|nr:CCR4-NOT transcriptional complex subunit CAF120 [Cryptococcus neoformans var. grubii D17-1]OXG99669.1 CCR4-NOT transcriptional complex subunit CAF120 [Cryptococcus neoformans var. grubii A2-102-5]
MQSTPGQGQQQQQQIPPPHAKGQAQGFQPAYAGDNIGRGKGAGAGAEGVKEKRRSGFGWLGGKKKDKEKERAKGERENLGNRPRPSSFSVDRPSTQSQTRALSTSASQAFPQSQQAQTPVQPQPQYATRPFAQNQTPSPPPGQQPRSLPTSSGQGVQAYEGQRSQSLDLGQMQQQHGDYRSGVINGVQGKGSPLAPQGQQQQSQQPRGQISRSASMPMQPPAPGTTPNGGSGSPRRGSTLGNPPQPDQAGPADAGHVDMDRFRSIVDLIAIQPQKTYVTSPPELEMILARTSAGGQPKQGQPGSATNDWDAVWLQLSGISLSMWSMKETRAAAAKGEKVPPTYFNITDSSLELLAPLPPPPHRPNSHPHHFVFSLNTAGSNRLLFSCPTELDLARWATGLRLAAWERARLEEIYTGHLVQSGGREPAVEVGKGRSRMEGWVRVRVMGGTEWRRLWLVLSTPAEGKEEEKKSKRRSFFGMGGKEEEQVPSEPNTGMVMASFYTEQRTSKNKTSVVPILTITNVSQTYAVFPERLEVMSQSNLFKVVGRISGEMVTVEGRLRDSGWALLMPEHFENAGAASSTSSLSSHGHRLGHHQVGQAMTPLGSMMRWVTGFHDAFKLYGRPEKYIWDTKDPKSLFFAYPQGQDRFNLFLDIEDALRTNFRVTTLAAVRSQFVSLLHRSQLSNQNRSKDENTKEFSEENEDQGFQRQDGNFRLPPLSFNEASQDPNLPRSLTPITERTDIASRQNSTRTANSAFTVVGLGGAGGSGDRKTSGTSSKHGSQSSKHEDHDRDRLPQVNDSHQAFGPLTEEPGEAYSNSGSNSTATPHVAPASLPGAAGGIQRNDIAPSSQESHSIYSQDTGATPTPVRVTPYQSAKPSPHMQPAPPLPTEPEQPDSDEGLPHPSILAFPIAHGQKSPLGKPVITNPDPPSASPPSPPPLPKQQLPAQPAPSQVLSPIPRKVSSGDTVPHGVELREEPAAKYLMNMVEEIPMPQPQMPKAVSPQRPTINTNFDGQGGLVNAVTNGNQEAPGVGKKEILGRKPSGARALPVRKSMGSRMQVIEDRPASSHIQENGQIQAVSAEPSNSNASSQTSQLDLGDDVSSYIHYADNPSPVKPKTAPPVQAEPVPPKSVSPPQEEIRSSFAPSKAAVERRAKAEQTAREQEMAKRMPGGGKRAVSNVGTMPGFESSDEESEEESEEDSPMAQKRQGLPLPPAASRAPEQASHETPQSATPMNARALPPVPRIQPPEVRLPAENNEPPIRRDSQFSQTTGQYDPRASQFLERPRPVSRTPSPGNGNVANGRPISTLAYNNNDGSYPIPGPRQSPANNAPPATRQTVWNANFSTEHGMPEQNKSGKFVELEEPSVQLTKAFAPHGLLQAGMQDKEERSAKKQEELARETGSSLINVAAKPPPPQTGLIGAVAAHERDRKNAGGIGATLTDREREKRLAEDRQREIERLQKQQTGQFGGDMYPQNFGYGMSPSPMAMGMNMPMMNMGYHGQMNPYAQQQAMLAAQMAYQQTMMAMSQAGSQAGDFPDRAQSSSQLRSRQQPGADGRSVSPTGSVGGQTSPPPMGVPSFYGYPQGMGMSPQMGMGMPQMQMPWMMSPGTMWGMPTPPTGPGSPMGQPRYDYMQPGNAGMGSEASSARGKNRGSSGEDLSQRVN